MEMNPDVLAVIRSKIPTIDITDDRIANLLYTSQVLMKTPDDIRDRAKIVDALGYDPEDKWK